MGPISDDGVARLRGHPGLEHFLPHPGDGHLKAEDVTASPPENLHQCGGWGAEPSGRAQEPTTPPGPPVSGCTVAGREQEEGRVTVI